MADVWWFKTGNHFERFDEFVWRVKLLVCCIIFLNYFCILCLRRSWFILLHSWLLLWPIPNEYKQDVKLYLSKNSISPSLSCSIWHTIISSLISLFLHTFPYLLTLLVSPRNSMSVEMMWMFSLVNSVQILCLSVFHSQRSCPTSKTCFLISLPTVIHFFTGWQYHFQILYHFFGFNHLSICNLPNNYNLSKFRLLGLLFRPPSN